MDDDFQLDPEFQDTMEWETRKKSASPPPDDDLSAPATPKGTILYLTVSTPHTDAWDWHGPFPSFAAILPIAQHLAKDSPTALATLEQVKSKGFTRLVVTDPIEETHFSVLEVLTRFNPDIRATLPKPVFTVSASGPMLHDYDAVYKTVKSADAKGKSSTSQIIGSYPSRDTALIAAKATMQELVVNEEDAPHVSAEFPAADAGGGLIMAMNARAKWEVCVFFETEGTY
ncbi:hypothetical protein P171DRAFT_159216 [Karstenula rhodostoma CBS 690.94]|uniref:Uncharacterized protein n=1 Tax=Karstenula rhodostoma CBS 690.94 TaxID=1392251 RepID=A0A9P4P881_9PLEO|nr:hypothetical protein P171DRAFT_159216 [Karstenula rhodostoma CBS 690.94]